MVKIFKYDMYRILGNKFFAGLAVIIILYSYQLMSREIVLGIANTAPYSSWSYGVFLAKMLPILLIAQLFFISLLNSIVGQKVKAIIDSTPIHPLRIGLLRCCAVTVGFCGSTLVSILVSIWFYAAYFELTDYSFIILPILVTVLPAMLFTLGIGTIAARIHYSALYVLMLLIPLLSILPIPPAMELLGDQLYRELPFVLPWTANAEPALMIPMSVWIGKLIYSIIGIILIIMGIVYPMKRTKN